MILPVSERPQFSTFPARPQPQRPLRTPQNAKVQFLGKQYDWVVIGNGPHGNIFATTMLEKGLPRNKLVVVDPLEPLDLWTKSNTNAGWSHNGQEVQRETDLSRQTEQYAKLQTIPLPITNLNLTLFLERLRTKFEGLFKPAHVKAQATTITKQQDTYKVHVREGSPIETRNVVLALGNYTEPIWPKWAKDLKKTHPETDIQHVFDRNFNLDEFKKNKRDIVIVGGGPVALNLALTLSKSMPGHITLLVRNPIRGTGISLINPCFLPEGVEQNHGYKDFKQLESAEKRRAFIQKHRPAGVIGNSIDYIAAINAAIKQKTLKIVSGEAESASTEAGKIKISLYPSVSTQQKRASEQHNTVQKELGASSVVLATGLKNDRPGGQFINNVIRDLALEVHPDGFPNIDEQLRWQKQKGLFVMGRLADHELGPYAWNIAGGVLGTNRIMGSEQAKSSLFQTAKL